MAVTKVSSAVHFSSRSAGVRGREGAASGHWVPNTDVYVTDTGLVVKVELAGMKSDSLEITVEGSCLRISGNRPDGCRASKCSFLVMEISDPDLLLASVSRPLRYSSLRSGPRIE